MITSARNSRIALPLVTGCDAARSGQSMVAVPYFFLFATNLIASYSAHSCSGSGAWMNFQTYQDCTSVAAMFGLWSAVSFAKGSKCCSCVPQIVQVCCIIAAAWLHVSMLVVSFYLSWLEAEAFHNSHSGSSGWFTLRVVRSVFVKVVLAEFLHVIFEQVLAARRSLPTQKPDLPVQTSSSSSPRTDLVARNSSATTQQSTQRALDCDETKADSTAAQTSYSDASEVNDPGECSVRDQFRATVGEIRARAGPTHGDDGARRALLGGSDRSVVGANLSPSTKDPEESPGPNDPLHTCAIVVTSVCGVVFVVGVFCFLFHMLHD